MTPIEQAICKAVKAAGGWPKSDDDYSRVERALQVSCVHTFNVSWHSVSVDGNRVMQQAYKQWEQKQCSNQSQ